VKTHTAVDDHQLLSTKKLIRKLTNSSFILTVDFIAESVDISSGSVYSILTEFVDKKVCTKHDS